MFDTKIPVIVLAKNADWIEGFQAGYGRAIDDWMVPQWEAGPFFDVYDFIPSRYFIRCRIFKHEIVYQVSARMVERFETEPLLFKEIIDRILASALLGAYGVR